MSHELHKMLMIILLYDYRCYYTCHYIKEILLNLYINYVINTSFFLAYDNNNNTPPQW